MGGFSICYVNVYQRVSNILKKNLKILKIDSENLALIYQHQPDPSWDIKQGFFLHQNLQSLQSIVDWQWISLRNHKKKQNMFPSSIPQVVDFPWRK